MTKQFPKLLSIALIISLFISSIGLTSAQEPDPAAGDNNSSEENEKNTSYRVVLPLVGSYSPKNLTNNTIEDESYPIIEEFDSDTGFTSTNPGRVYIADGKVHWNISRRGGPQFVYRDIPAFSGDVKLTVQGQVNSWNNNCIVRAGIGDGFDARSDQTGISINYGFVGGGCGSQRPTTPPGAIVMGTGAQFDYYESPACNYHGNWLRINPSTPYTAEFTISEGLANLTVPGIGSATGDPIYYNGRYDTLFVGFNGTGDWPSCSGTIDSISVEPLEVSSVKAAFTVDNPVGYMPHKVKFTNHSTGDIYLNLWDFGDNNTSNQKDPVHTYFDVGKHKVTLTVLAHENQLDRAETIITVKEPPTASNIKITDNLIESHPCGPTITPGLPSFLQRTPLVDYSVDFTISDPSVIESVALNIDGKLTEPQLLSDIGTGTPNEYSYRLYKIMGRDESDFSFKQFLVGICSDIAGLGIGTGSAFCPFEMFVDAPEPKKDYGELWELKLIRNDGYKYPVTVTGKPKLRTIHDRAPRDSLSRCDVAVFSSYSPVDLLVTDDLGRQIGNTESGEVIEIPNSYYTGPDKGNEFIVVFSPETGKELSLEVKGTGIGEYGLLYGYYKHDEKKVGGYIKQNVPISEGTLHDYSIVPGVNNPPSCSDAIPSIDNLWSPNHKFVSVDVLGVTDPEGDAISITVDSIFQDEPVDGYGDGSFTPDGRGVGTSTAGLRVERAGGGNGRVYHVSFTADDGHGGTCSGKVLVGVPKSSSPYKAPVDEGPLYDSTKVGQ